jgi:hypothetical protein
VWDSDEIKKEDLYKKIMLEKEIKGKKEWKREEELGKKWILEKVKEWVINLK